MIWAYLAHLSFNMWEEADAPVPENLSPAARRNYETRKARTVLSFDEETWDALLAAFQAHGINMVVLDLGNSVQYDSHPEIAVRDAWSPAWLRQELARLRALGIEPIPKLNFSTTHDEWLGPYARCVSTDAYYAVCRDLIAEVAALFDRPRFFHLGMDEETAGHQRYARYAVMRQFDLWWHDLYFLQEQVEGAGSRAWVWSDYLWEHPDEFLRNMPKSVVQSNWYYGAEFNEEDKHVKAYLDLEAHGYEQVPTGSTWSCEENFPNTVSFAAQHIGSERLLGFLQAPWRPTRAEFRQTLLHAAEVTGEAGRMEGWKNGKTDG
jgi:hypothetical protein